MSAVFHPRLGPVLERLRAGQRWWPAEIGARLLALALLAGFWRLALVEHARAITPRVHPATLPDLLLCAALVVLLLCALLLGIAGPGLLRRVDLNALREGRCSARGDFSSRQR